MVSGGSGCREPPSLQKNVIQGHQQSGVFPLDNAAGQASGNTILQNGNPGISAWDDAQPTLSDNVIQETMQSGAVFADPA
ncbi:hypothetical protein [Deinococcus sp.]|uniref:hypothetical protein n=1 Tax=Deinococcus sp. TaxID=47478 RepID=UPI003CC525D4